MAFAFWSWCACTGEAQSLPCCPGEKARQDWRTKPFPAAATFSQCLVAEFQVTVSVSPAKVRVNELSVTTAWKRLSWTETVFGAIYWTLSHYPDSGHRLKLQVSTQDSLKAVASSLRQILALAKLSDHRYSMI